MRIDRISAMLLAMSIVTGCGGPRAEAAPAPAVQLEPVAPGRLCVTKGAIADAAIAEPTVRAVVPGSHGDAVQLTFTYGGRSARARALASGQLRRQVGLKLRAANGCNLVYVMWRLDPHPRLEVSVKYNPGMRTHAECGANGYIKVRPAHAAPPPGLAEGASHVLRAEIRGDALYAWIDGQLAWRGELPDEARALAGPAGLRTDNVHLPRIELAVARGGDAAGACKRHEQD